MFNPVTAVREWAYAGQPAAGKTHQSAASFVESEGPGGAAKQDRAHAKPVRNPGWLLPEWWEHHNYDRR